MKLTHYPEIVEHPDGTLTARIYSRKGGLQAELSGKPDDIKAWLAEQMKAAAPVNPKEVH